MSAPRNRSSHPSKAEITKLQLIMGLVFVFLPILSAQAQSYNILHDFTGQNDGAEPLDALTVDKSGSLYGTSNPGNTSTGSVFKMTKKGSGWVFAPLYDFPFPEGSDGAQPWAGVTIGPDGTLYGTTYVGGASCSQGGCGTVYNVKPSPSRPRSVLEPWKESVLYRFTRGADGAYPRGEVVFDTAGNMYGTTSAGGDLTDRGTVFELTRSGSGWTFNVIHTFNGLGGLRPYAGVILDSAGNLYGTTNQSDNGCGVVFEMSPSASGWTYTVLHEFVDCVNDGAYPWGPLLMDASGNLYGTTGEGGVGNGGTVFMLSPSGGGFSYKVLYSFTGVYGTPNGPSGHLAMDTSGNLYGTRYEDNALGNAQGSVFKLTPSNGSWIFTELHSFDNRNDHIDGANPYGGVALDTNGNLFGTTQGGGMNSYGTVFEITP